MAHVTLKNPKGLNVLEMLLFAGATGGSTYGLYKKGWEIANKQGLISPAANNVAIFPATLLGYTAVLAALVLYLSLKNACTETPSTLTLKPFDENTPLVNADADGGSGTPMQNTAADVQEVTLDVNRSTGQCRLDVAWKTLSTFCDLLRMGLICTAPLGADYALSAMIPDYQTALAARTYAGYGLVAAAVVLNTVTAVGRIAANANHAMALKGTTTHGFLSAITADHRHTVTAAPVATG